MLYSHYLQLYAQITGKIIDEVIDQKTITNWKQIYRCHLEHFSLCCLADQTIIKEDSLIN